MAQGAAKNVCGQPCSLQIRLNVSPFGQRSPASISRYSRTLTPMCHAACPAIGGPMAEEQNASVRERWRMSLDEGRSGRRKHRN